MNRPARSRAARLGTQLLATLAGGREPVVLVLLLISFFTTVSGKPLDGVLMLVVAGGLAWDAGRRRHARAAVADLPARPAASQPGAPGGAGPALPAGELAAAAATPAGTDSLTAGWPDGSHLAATRRSWPLAAVPLAAGLLYCLVVGSFTRYSWPATIAVMAVGAAAVARGWRGPVRQLPDPGPLPLTGTAVWGGLLVAGGLWELSALLQQPTLTTGSYAHPTISTLTDPLLASTPGRTLLLGAWLLLGWTLVRR